MNSIFDLIRQVVDTRNSNKFIERERAKATKTLSKCQRSKARYPQRFDQQTCMNKTCVLNHIYLSTKSLMSVVEQANERMNENDQRKMISNENKRQKSERSKRKKM